MTPLPNGSFSGLAEFRYMQTLMLDSLELFQMGE
jgi:hypothetical protein